MEKCSNCDEIDNHKHNYPVKNMDLFKKKKNYWNNRYLKGRSSGKGSIGKLKKWKWNQINSLIDITRKSIIDLGNGDLSFWENINEPKSYIGIDISGYIQEKNKIQKRNWTFLTGNITELHSIQAEVVFCLDVLFHITNHNDFISILQNLSIYAKEILFVYTWFNNPNSDNNYQKYYDFQRYLDKFKEFTIECRIPNTEVDSIGALWIFTRK